MKLKALFVIIYIMNKIEIKMLKLKKTYIILSKDWKFTKFCKMLIKK